MPALPLRCTPPHPAPCNGTRFGISCQPMHCCGTAHKHAFCTPGAQANKSATLALPSHAPRHAMAPCSACPASPCTLHQNRSGTAHKHAIVLAPTLGDQEHASTVCVLHVTTPRKLQRHTVLHLLPAHRLNASTAVALALHQWYKQSHNHAITPQGPGSYCPYQSTIEYCCSLQQRWGAYGAHPVISIPSASLHCRTTQWGCWSVHAIALHTPMRSDCPGNLMHMSAESPRSGLIAAARDRAHPVSMHMHGPMHGAPTHF